ncbi:MAG: hypothetical protein GY861_28530 [bacterium]|nr:hypothetical protein [bacterium]
MRKEAIALFAITLLLLSTASVIATNPHGGNGHWKDMISKVCSHPGFSKYCHSPQQDNAAIYGQLKSGNLLAYASCYAGSDPGCEPTKKFSGRVQESKGHLPKLGKVTVELSACWDWGRGHTAPNQMYSTDHKGALLVTTPQNFEDHKPGTPVDGPFSADSTVIIKTKRGNIEGKITGGSVYELEVHPGGGSINEWTVNFEIVGGTKRMNNKKGTGTYRMVWDSNKDPAAYGDTDGLMDPARYLSQEVTLRLK